MAQLDKSKPFGEVLGHPVWKYQQGDNYYNAQGEACKEDGTLIAAPKKQSEPKQEQPTSGEPYMKHRGGAKFCVYDASGELVGDSFSKAEAIAKVEELKNTNDQIDKALSDE